MQTPRFPFNREMSVITAYYNFRYASGGLHGAWDIVPSYTRLDGKPADVFPVFSGKTQHISDSSNANGRGIKVRTILWPDIIQYFKQNNVIPQNQTGEIWLDILYWHLLDVTDEDLVVEQGTPVGIAGNTGWIMSQSYVTPANPTGLVPDSMKGVPPYPGLHLHIEFILGSGSQTFNFDKDTKGRIDPKIVFNYKPKGESMRLVNDNGTVFLVGDKGKIGIANEPFYNALKEIATEEVGSTESIPQMKVVESATAFLIKDN